MNKSDLNKKIKNAFFKILEEEDLLKDNIEIISTTLTPEEAIGITKRKDFPINTGSEIMLQAEYMGSYGQAFTDSPAVFKGTLEEICNMDLEKDPRAAGLFVASLNAVMKYLGKADCTVHCKGEEPEKCSKEAVAYIKEHYGNIKIALVGYQPSLLEYLSKEFELRVLFFGTTLSGVAPLLGLKRLCFADQYV